MPAQLQPLGKGVRVVGYGRQIDDFILSMKRAAERAAPAAKQIFWDATAALKILSSDCQVTRSAIILLDVDADDEVWKSSSRAYAVTPFSLPPGMNKGHANDPEYPSHANRHIFSHGVELGTIPRPDETTALHACVSDSHHGERP